MSRYDQAWNELVALHQQQLAERLGVEARGDAVEFKLGEQVAGVLERGDGRSAETTGWFLWQVDAAGDIDVELAPEWICVPGAPEDRCRRSFALAAADPGDRPRQGLHLARGGDAMTVIAPRLAQLPPQVEVSDIIER